MQAIYDYARDVARKAIDAEYEMSSKNEEAQEFAGGASTYFSFNTAWKAVEDSKGANTAAFEAVMQDYERMSTQKQNALMEALDEGTRFDDVVDAYEAGIDPERWYEAYLPRHGLKKLFSRDVQRPGNAAQLVERVVLRAVLTVKEP